MKKRRKKRFWMASEAHARKALKQNKHAIETTSPSGMPSDRTLRNPNRFK